MYACMNCLKRSSVGVAEEAVAAVAVAARAGAAGPDAAGAVEAGEPESVSEAVKSLDSVVLLESLGAGHLNVAGVDPLATPRVTSPCTGTRRREGAIQSGDGKRNSLPSKRAGWTVLEVFRIVKVDQLLLVDQLRKRGGCSAWVER